LARGTHSPDRARHLATPKPAPPGQGQTTPQANPSSLTTADAPAGSQTDDEGHPRTDAHSAAALVVPNPSGQSAKELPPPNGPPLADPTLALAADILDDLERVKIANANRLRALTRDTEDSDGEIR